MERFILQLKEELETSLQQVKRNEPDMLRCSEECINLLEQGFDKLKTFVLSYTFKDETEEIIFFKQVKPELFCRLIFYHKLYNIELDKPAGGTPQLRTYLDKELSRIRDYYDKTADFYHYYRSGSTYMDHQFFLRRRPDIRLSIESFYFERDPAFSTSHDFKVAKIMANNMLEKYIQQELNHYKEDSPAKFLRVKLTWTASKVFLTELIYALFLFGAFNHEKATLKEMIAYFEEVFNIYLGANPSKTYVEMRNRKQRTTFLDRLREILGQKMDQDDK